MARSVLEIILRLKGDKATRELKKVDKELKKVDKSTKGAGDTLKKFDAKMAMIAGGAGLAAAGVVKMGEAIWNMGKRGAAVAQTGESFDFLIEKLELTPTLLEDLSRASRGTVDEMTLMSSTATLLAGTSDELGNALGNATPQLMEIAKAANKLNPSLGTTAHMYESIATGIKRASPMILDNLGLTIKIGKANEDFAKSIGKTADQLTAEEQQMALLNATIEAGDNLIAQVGGNVDAAGDSFAQMEVAVKNLKDELSKEFVPAIIEAIEAIMPLIEGYSEWADVERSLRTALDDGVISKEKHLELHKQWLKGNLDNAEAARILEQAYRNWRAEMGLMDWQLVELTGHERAYIETVEDSADALDEAGGMTDEYRERMARLNQESAIAIQTLRELAQQKIDDFFDVDMGIGDVAARMFDITQFKEFGGEALEIMVREVRAGLAQGKITPEQSREFFKNIAIEAEAIKVQMGEIDASEAAEAIAEEFNIPLGESRELIDSVLEGIDLVNSADISAITEEFDALQERKELLMEMGEIPIEADPQDQAKLALEGLQQQVVDLTDDPWILTVKVVTEGVLPGGSTTTTEEEEDGGGAQHGANFIVPPGYPNDTFPLRVTSGEHVQVTPRGQVQSGSASYTQYVTQHFHSEGAAALGMAIARKFGRDRLGASMGR